MNDQELFDVLDAAGEPTGLEKNRTQVHRDGDWHRSVHIWIVREGQYVLFQRRAETKDLEPGKLDVTVGGHLRAGEMIVDAVREVEEELGLQVQFHDLHYLGSRQSERRYAHATDREFQEVYLLEHDQPLEHYALDPHEVYVLYELSIESALALYRYGKPAAAAGFDAYGRPNHALLIEDDIIGQARDEVVEALQWIRAWFKEKGRGEPAS